MKFFFQILLLASMAGSVGKAALVYNANNIVNPGAEAGSGSLNGDTGGTPIPGWALNGNLLAVQYGIGLGFPAGSDPGPSARGNNFFSGGPNNSFAQATQLLSVTNAAAAIDVGAVPFTLSGYLGGFDSEEDNAVLSAIFQDGAGATISSVQIGPVGIDDRGAVTALCLRTLSGFIPIGTRSILFDLRMTRALGNYNDGYADELSFVAESPEPSTFAFMLVAAGASLTLRRLLVKR